MQENNLKYAVSAKFEEIKLPPFRDILVVAKNCEHGKVALTKSFEMMMPGGFETIDLDHPKIETVYITKSLLLKMPLQNILDLLYKNVFPSIYDGQLIKVDFTIKTSFEDIVINQMEA